MLLVNTYDMGGLSGILLKQKIGCQMALPSITYPHKCLTDRNLFLVLRLKAYSTDNGDLIKEDTGLAVNS